MYLDSRCAQFQIQSCACEPAHFHPSRRDMFPTRSNQKPNRCSRRAGRNSNVLSGPHRQRKCLHQGSVTDVPRAHLAAILLIAKRYSPSWMTASSLNPRFRRKEVLRRQPRSIKPVSVEIRTISFAFVEASEATEARCPEAQQCRDTGAMIIAFCEPSSSASPLPLSGVDSNYALR
jgi:hypothetical protein